jgi:hypothetical protein
MAHFEDLQRCTPFTMEWRNPLAVGWLAKGHSYRNGAADLELANSLWRCRGVLEGPGEFRRCELCEGEEVARGEAGVIFVPGRDALYVAPKLIAHFIRKHGYVPPDEFSAALRDLPEPRNREAALDFHRVNPHGIRPRPKTGRYDAADIRVLEGLEPVRVRPGMYIGRTNGDGLAHLLFEVVSNGFDEYLRGFANELSVQVDQRGWVTVEDNGRGIPVEIHGMTGRSALEVVLTALHSGATFDGHHPHVHLQSSLQGVGLAVVNALSARFEVESRRSGVAYRAAFEAGRLIEPLTRVGETSMKGTRIRFLRDDEIFDEGSTLDLTKVEARLTELSWLSGALNVRFQDKHLPHAGGLAGWVRRLAPDVITETLLEIADSARRVDVALTLAWSPSGNGPRVMSFVNYHPTIDGGSHAEGVLSAVTAAASARSPSSDRLLAGLVAIVHVGLLDPDFGGPNTTSLHVEDVRLAVHEVVTRAINNAPWWWDKLHEVIG